MRQPDTSILIGWVSSHLSVDAVDIELHVIAIDRVDDGFPVGFKRPLRR